MKKQVLTKYLELIITIITIIIITILETKTYAISSNATTIIKFEDSYMYEKICEDETTKVYKFTESVEEFNNPDMGIYRPTAIQCQAVGEWNNTRIQYANGLVHLRIGLKSFTKAGNGVQDYDITEEHIEKLNQYMRSSKRGRRNGYCKICI